MHYFSYVSVNHKNCNLHSLTQRCPELCSAWISAVCDFSQLDSGLSPTFLNLTQSCPGLFSAWLSAVPDSAQLDKALSQTVLSGLRTVAGFIQLYATLSRTAVSLYSALYLTQRCPGHCSAWFSAVLEIVMLLPVTYFCLISIKKLKLVGIIFVFN